MTKEQKFYKALQDVFIGAQIEGTGGFVKKQSEFDSFINKTPKNSYGSNLNSGVISISGKVPKNGARIGSINCKS